jgi:hypothetical protein
MKQGAALEAEMQWFGIVDAFCGMNFRLALERARTCAHPDAQWLSALYPVEAVQEITFDYLAVLEAQKSSDPRVLFFLGAALDNGKLRESAELGYVPAQALMSEVAETPDEQCMWAEKATQSANRNALFQLALHLLTGQGCERDVARAERLLRQAASLGHTGAAMRLGKEFYAHDDWLRYHWFGVALEGRFPAARRALRSAALRMVRWYDRRECTGRPLFEIGRALERDQGRPKDAAQESVQRCVELYRQWVALAEEAIRCWTAVGRRLGVGRDMRRLIAQLLWRDRAAWSDVRLG